MSGSTRKTQKRKSCLSENGLCAPNPWLTIYQVNAPVDFMYFNGHHLRAHAPFFSSFCGMPHHLGPTQVDLSRQWHLLATLPRQLPQKLPDPWDTARRMPGPLGRREKNMISDRGQHDHPYSYPPSSASWLQDLASLWLWHFCSSLASLAFVSPSFPSRPSSSVLFSCP